LIRRRPYNDRVAAPVLRKEIEALLFGRHGNFDQTRRLVCADQHRRSRPDRRDQLQSGADLMSHSTFIYLMSPAGKLAALFSQGADADTMTTGLRRPLSS
jgi:cytochrome oxidase Cu insertion factor (SCO1/SenC/PrrC family)